MTPVEVFRDEIFSQETWERLRGKKLSGILYYPQEEAGEADLLEFQADLWNFLTDHGQTAGGHLDPRTKERWTEWRQKIIEEHGQRALVTLFPQSHKLVTQFVHALINRGRIYTIDDLIEKQARLGQIKGFRDQGKQRQAAQMIIDFFKDKKV
jgi:hypothetical protein